MSINNVAGAGVIVSKQPVKQTLNDVNKPKETLKAEISSSTDLPKKVLDKPELYGLEIISQDNRSELAIESHNREVRHSREVIFSRNY